MNKDKIKNLIDYIINDKNIEKNIEKFNDGNTYFSNISKKLNIFSFIFFIGMNSFLLCNYFNFSILGMSLTTVFSVIVAFLFSGISSDENFFKFPYLYYLFPHMKANYVKKQREKLKKLYRNENKFYQSMNEIKKWTEPKSLYKYFCKSKLKSRKRMLELLLKRLYETKHESDYISDLSSIILELNISKNKNNASKYLFDSLNSAIKSFEEDASFKKSIISYSDSDSSEKDNAIQLINNNLQKIQMIKKL